MPNQQDSLKASADSTRLWMRWALIGGAVVAVGAIAQIPIPQSVRADAYLEPLPDSHRLVHAQVPGTVTAIPVRQGQSVAQGEVIAVLQPLELQEQILAKRTQLQQAKATLAGSQQALTVAQAQLQEAQARSQLSQARATLARSDVQAMNSATPPPSVAQAQADRAALAARVQQLQNKAENLRQQFEKVSQEVNELRDPVEQGAIQRKYLSDAETRQLAIKGEWQETEDEVATVQAQIQAKGAQVAAAQDQVTEDWRDRADETVNLQAAWQTAQQQWVAAVSAVGEQTQVVATLEAELAQLLGQQQDAKRLEAPIAGTVVSTDLVQKVGRRMEANEAIVEIVNAAQLNAIIDAPQADSDVLKPGAKVVIKPLEPGLPDYETTLTEIEPVIQTDATQQQRLARGRALVNNPDGQLLPNAKVYAHIAAEPIPLYESVRRELMKLFKVRKYS
jgi:multidrug efflux pump subunit AcrA (membrane-fusion protein)